METLNYVQRAALLAAQERRMKAAKLAALQAAIAAAQAPDYFTAMERRVQCGIALRMCRKALRGTVGAIGLDPYNNERALGYARLERIAA